MLLNLKLNSFVTGKGKRLIITHIGSEEGFVEGALHVFESKNMATITKR